MHKDPSVQIPKRGCALSELAVSEPDGAPLPWQGRPNDSMCWEQGDQSGGGACWSGTLQQDDGWRGGTVGIAGVVLCAVSEIAVATAARACAVLVPVVAMAVKAYGGAVAAV